MKRRPPKPNHAGSEKGSAEHTTAPPSRQIQRALGNRGFADLLNGKALPGGVRGRLEKSFGTPLDALRVHDDAQAAAIVGAQHFRAATIGNHLFFSPGSFRPGAPESDRILAHEAAHALQQSSGRQGPSNAATETEAQAASGRFAAGERAVVQHTAAAEPAGLDEDLDAKVQAPKQPVLDAAIERLELNRSHLAEWESLLYERFSAEEFSTQVRGQVALDFFQKAQAIGRPDVYDQLMHAGNPAYVELYSGQLEGKYTACTGCHLANYAYGQGEPPGWLRPGQRLARVANFGTPDYESGQFGALNIGLGVMGARAGGKMLVGREPVPAGQASEGAPAGRALLGKQSPPPSSPISPALKAHYMKAFNSRAFRLRVELWSKLRGKPVDWSKVEALLENAEFREYATLGEAAKSLGYAGLNAEGKMVIGLVRPLRRIPIVGQSAAQHEIYHVYQETAFGTLAKEAQGSGLGFGSNLWAEARANIVGGPGEMILFKGGMTVLMFAGIDQAFYLLLGQKPFSMMLDVMFRRPEKQQQLQKKQQQKAAEPAR